MNAIAFGSSVKITNTYDTVSKGLQRKPTRWEYLPLSAHKQKAPNQSGLSA